MSITTEQREKLAKKWKEHNLKKKSAIVLCTKCNGQVYSESFVAEMMFRYNVLLEKYEELEKNLYDKVHGL